MTFIYELDPYSLQIYRIGKYEQLRLSKIIVGLLQTDTHTPLKLYTGHAASGMVKIGCIKSRILLPLI